MPTQLKSIVSTVFIVHIVAAGIAGIVGSAAQAADECRGAPSGPSAKGQHWFYRVDRASHRKCWYQRAHDAAAQRTAPPPSPSNEVAEAVPPAEPVARPTAFAQAPIWPEPVPTSDRRDTISDFPWPKPAEPARVVDREDIGVSTAIKQAEPTPNVMRIQKAPDARLSNATDGKGQNPTRLAALASAAPVAAAVIPASESDTLTPFRILLLFIGIIVVPGILLPLIFRFGASIRKKISADEEDRKNWRDSVTHNWAPSKFDAEAPALVPRKPIPQSIETPIDPEQLLRKILRELEQAAVKTVAEPADRRFLSSV